MIDNYAGRYRCWAILLRQERWHQFYIEYILEIGVTGGDAGGCGGLSKAKYSGQDLRILKDIFFWLERFEYVGTLPIY